MPAPAVKDETIMNHIDTGDVVRHGPTGEAWVVAYVKGKYLAWCGWPEGEARVSDCSLLKKATPEEKEKLLQELADMPEDDARRRYARRLLAAQKDKR
jgi:hypothetical protein